jgi:hypothetical protein
MPAERTPHADDSLLAQPLFAVTERALRAPGAVLAGALVLALLSIVVAVNGLTFKTSRLDLLNPRSEYNRRWLAYLQEFGDRDDAVLVVRSQQPADLTAALDDLGARLQAEPLLFESVFYRRDLSALKRKALHYLAPEELASIETQLRRAVAELPSPALAQEGAPANPAAQLATLNDQLAHVGAASPQQRARIEAEYARAAGHLLAAMEPASQYRGPSAPAADGLPYDRMQHGNHPLVERAPPPEIQRLSFTGNSATPPTDLAQFEPQYLLADEGRMGFVLCKFVRQPGESAPNSRAMTRVRQLVRDTERDHPGAWIGLTGMPVIEHDEMHASQIDMIWTSLLEPGGRFGTVCRRVWRSPPRRVGLLRAALGNGLHVRDGDACHWASEHFERCFRRRVDRPGHRFWHSLRRQLPETARFGVRRPRSPAPHGGGSGAGCGHRRGHHLGGILHGRDDGLCGHPRAGRCCRRRAPAVRGQRRHRLAAADPGRRSPLAVGALSRHSASRTLVSLSRPLAAGHDGRRPGRRGRRQCRNRQPPLRPQPAQFAAAAPGKRRHRTAASGLPGR